MSDPTQEPGTAAEEAGIVDQQATALEEEDTEDQDEGDEGRFVHGGGRRVAALTPPTAGRHTGFTTDGRLAGPRDLSYNGRRGAILARTPAPLPRGESDVSRIPRCSRYRRNRAW